MAELHGKGGMVNWDSGDVTAVTEWSLNYEGEIHDVTSMDTSGWRKRLAGLKQWTGTFSCREWPGDEVGTSATINLELVDGSPSTAHPTFTGTAFIAAINVTESHDDVVGYEVTFEGSETMTITTA